MLWLDDLHEAMYKSRARSQNGWKRSAPGEELTKLGSVMILTPCLNQSVHSEIQSDGCTYQLQGSREKNEHLPLQQTSRSTYEDQPRLPPIPISLRFPPILCLTSEQRGRRMLFRLLNACDLCSRWEYWRIGGWPFRGWERGEGDDVFRDWVRVGRLDGGHAEVD